MVIVGLASWLRPRSDVDNFERVDKLFLLDVDGFELVDTAFLPDVDMLFQQGRPREFSGWFCSLAG